MLWQFEGKFGLKSVRIWRMPAHHNNTHTDKRDHRTDPIHRGKPYSIYPSEPDQSGRNIHSSVCCVHATTGSRMQG